MTGTLRLLLDARDAEGVAPAAVRSEVVAAFDADAWSAWTAAGASVLPWPSGASAQQMTDEAFALWRAHASVEWRGCNLMEIVAYRHLRWISRAAWVSAAVREAVERSRPDVVLLHVPRGISANRPHLLDLLPGEQSMPALGTLAEAVARSCGAAVMHVERAEVAAPGAPAVTEAATTPSQCARASSRSLRGAEDLREGHLLVISDAVDIRRHDAMLHAWLGTSRARSGGGAVHVTHDAAVAMTCAGKLSAPLLHQDLYAGPRNETAPDGKIGAAALDALLCACRGARGAGASLLHSPGLLPHLSHLFGPYAQRVAAGMDRWSTALQRRRPSAVVASYPCIALEMAARSGIPSLLLPHGPMMSGARAYHRVLPRTVVLGAAGLVHERVLRGEGMEAKRVVVTGCGSAVIDAVRPARNPEGARPLRVLLPVSGAVRPAQIGMLPAPDVGAEARAVGELACAAAAQQWRVDIRRHPRFACSEAFYRRLWTVPAPVIFSDADHVPLSAAVEACDVVICIGGPSSVIAEAAVLGRPMWVVRSTLAPHAAALWGLEDFPAVRDMDELIETLSRLRGDIGAWQEAVRCTLRAGRAFLDSRPLTAARAIDRVIAGSEVDADARASAWSAGRDPDHGAAERHAEHHLR